MTARRSLSRLGVAATISLLSCGVLAGCGSDTVEGAVAGVGDAAGDSSGCASASGCEADTGTLGAAKDTGVAPDDSGVAPDDTLAALGDTGAAPDDTGPAPEDTQGATAPLAGACPDAPEPEITTVEWKHAFASPLTLAAGAPNHRVRDIIASAGAGAQLRGRFTYGVIDKDLEDEEIQLWVRTCPGWELLGSQVTDVDGVVWFSLPALEPGDYAVHMIVSGDATVAYGHVAVWPQGMPVIVTDVDGTLTTSDWQLFQDQLGGPSAEEVEGGHEVMQRWVEKGYRILYLTGRPQVFNRYSNDWLRSHGFPEGVVHLTDDVGDVLPTESGVQAFKAAWLKQVESEHAVVWMAAYGNASTDIGAYGEAGLAKETTFIYGPNGGDDGTTALDSYVDHLSWVEAAPDAALPAP